MRLQIDVAPFHLPVVSIPYQQFHVADAASDYRLTITSDTPGQDSLYTSLNFNSGEKFSTYDRKNSITDCSVYHRAGWWFDHCTCTLLNLNGVYGGACELARYNIYMDYLSDGSRPPISAVTMKIKPIN